MGNRKGIIATIIVGAVSIVAAIVLSSSATSYNPAVVAFWSISFLAFGISIGMLIEMFLSNNEDTKKMRAIIKEVGAPLHIQTDKEAKERQDELTFLDSLTQETRERHIQEKLSGTVEEVETYKTILGDLERYGCIDKENVPANKDEIPNEIFWSRYVTRVLKNDYPSAEERRAIDDEIKERKDKYLRDKEFDAQMKRYIRAHTDK